MLSGLAGALLSAGAVHAAVSTAMGGIPQKPAEATCFPNATGTISNVCTGVRQWCITDAVNSGSRNVSVTGIRPNGGSLTCQAQAVDAQAHVTGNLGPLPFTTVDVTSTLSMGSLSVPGGGSLYVCCNLSQNASLDSFSF
jgi:hypothetical protein